MSAADPAPDRPFQGAVVAFDLDGTLVDTAPDLVGTLNTVLAQEGLPPMTLEAARPLIGRGARSMLERGFAAEGVVVDPLAMPALFERFIDIYLRRIARESRPFPGVEVALDLLAEQGALLAVCTNKPTRLSLALLDALGMASRFASVIGPDAAPAAKPDPRHLITAVETAGGRIERALMVGDSKTDLDAARAAGVPVALVSFGYTEIPAADLAPDALVESFDELHRALAALLAACR
ncbi:MAG: phosphoglycolate phosphatase [Caulobacterales bacterium]